ncbi:MAG: ABC transporter permease [Actinomycetota bacterium]
MSPGAPGAPAGAPLPHSIEFHPPGVPAAKSRSRVVRFWKAYGLAVLFSLVMLGIWEFWIWFFHVPKYLLASPSGIVIALKQDWSAYLLPNMWPTLAEVAVGFAIAVVAGVGLAIVLHLFTPLRRAVYPILIGSQTIPIVVLAPILVILLGYGPLPKVMIVALICFFPIVVNGLDGLRLVDDDFIHMMRTLDATRWAIFRKVEFPGALPSIFSGMRVAATFAAIGAVFGEWSGASKGLGYLIQASTPNLQTARIFACIVLLTLIAMALFGLVSLLERLVCPWASRGGGI